MLNTGNFIPSRAIIFGDLRLNNDPRGPLIRDYKVRSLVKSLYFLSTFGLAETHLIFSQLIFNSILHNFTDQF